MVLDLKTLTEWLEIEEHRIIELKESILEWSNNPKKLRSILDQQCEYREQTHCYSCRNEAGCLVLNGIGYLHLGEIETAIRELETANLHFRNQDKTWNHIISLVLLGEAYEKNRKDHRALREFEKAHNAVKLFRQIHSTEYLQNAIHLEKILKDRVDTLSDKKTAQ
jgi:flagellar biosynthesis chaperone FliJ